MADDEGVSKEQHERGRLAFCACHGHAFESKETRLHVGGRSEPPALGQIGQILLMR